MKNWDSKNTKRIREFPLVLFVSEKENALLVTGTVNSKENSKSEKFSSEYDFSTGKSCVIL